MALTALFGCQDEEPVTFENESPFCVGSYEVGGSDVIDGTLEEMPFVGELPIYGTAVFDYCLSSSCDIDRQANCAMRLQSGGEIIDVSTHGSYTRASANMCTQDCGTLAAHCRTTPLPEGDYIIRYNGQEKPLTIPSTGTPVCFD